MTACVRSEHTAQRTYLSEPDRFLRGFIAILDEETPDLVVLDNLGYVLQLAPAGAGREILNRIIRVFTIRGITALLLSETTLSERGFQAYDVDGVIELSYDEARGLLR